jgi:high-affinity nickel permease
MSNGRRPLSVGFLFSGLGFDTATEVALIIGTLELATAVSDASIDLDSVGYGIAGLFAATCAVGICASRAG